MKAKSTIEKQMKLLREFINYHDIDPSTARIRANAYEMETALQWVLDQSTWSPVSLCASDLRHVKEKI